MQTSKWWGARAASRGSWHWNAATKAAVSRAELWEEKLTCNQSFQWQQSEMGINMREIAGVRNRSIWSSNGHIWEEGRGPQKLPWASSPASEWGVTKVGKRRAWPEEGRLHVLWMVLRDKTTAISSEHSLQIPASRPAWPQSARAGSPHLLSTQNRGLGI